MTVNGETTKTPSTDEQGRAEFTGLPAGANGARRGHRRRRAAAVRAVHRADLRRASRDPGRGHRAGGRAARSRKRRKPRPRPPVKGVVVLGGNSRIIMEFPDDSLRVFYMLEIVNNARDARGHRRAAHHRPAGRAPPARRRSRGRRRRRRSPATAITVTGPFASGVTPVQVGVPAAVQQLRRSTIEQTWPAAVEQVTVGVAEGRRAVDCRRRSSRSSATSSGEDGDVFVLASGPALPAGRHADDAADRSARAQPRRRATSRSASRSRSSLLGVWLALHRARRAARVAAGV